MSFRDQVDSALADYKGVSLEGLSLGPEVWSGFIGETRLTPDDFGQVEYRGIPISQGIEGIKYIVTG